MVYPWDNMEIVIFGTIEIKILEDTFGNMELLQNTFRNIDKYALSIVKISTLIMNVK